MKRSIVGLLGALVGVCGSMAPALAVPIGTTPDTRPAAPQQRRQWKDFGVGMELGGNWLQGNANVMTMSALVNLNANSGPHQLYMDLGNLYNQAGPNVLVNRLAGSALYAYGLLDNLNLYGYTTHSRDQATKLDYRLTTGAGVCLHRIASEAFPLFLVSLAPVLENEWYASQPMSSTWRTALRLNAIRPITESMDLGVDAFYMPAVTDAGDYRLYGEASLRFKLSQALSLKVTAADEYDARPQPGVQNNDYGVFTTLALDWGR